MRLNRTLTMRCPRFDWLRKPFLRNVYEDLLALSCVHVDSRVRVGSGAREACRIERHQDLVPWFLLPGDTGLVLPFYAEDAHVP